MSLTLNEAIALVDRGIAKASEMGLKLSFVVVDEFGQLVQLDRMDGAPLVSPDIAEAKAVTAVSFRQPTSEVAKMDGETLKTIGEIAHFKVIAVPGGIPILNGEELRGAIGVSGATPQQEEDIARHAVSLSRPGS
jgi:uncharacterized protein GlcG (DUF336 family)